MAQSQQTGQVPPSSLTRRPRVFYGWWIVGAASMLWMYGAAYPFTFGIFINVLSKEYGWSMGPLSAAVSIGAISMSILGPPIGYLVDRFGPRLVMMGGVVATGVAFLLVQFVDSLWLFYLVFGFLLPSSSGPVFTGGSAAAANWFKRRRAFAISLLTTAWVGGGAIIAPAGAWLVGEFGWQLAAAVFGVVYLVTGIPLCLVMRHRPEDHGLLPDGDSPAQEDASATPGEETSPGEGFTLSQALRTRAFWMLALAGLGLSMSNSSVTTHQVPLLTHRDFDPQTAANALALMAFFSALGRPFMGYLADRYSKQLLLGVFISMMAAGTLVLGMARSMEMVYLYTVLYGAGFAVFPVVIAMVADYFGRKSFATIQQTMQAIGTLGFASGPFYVGRFFDATNEYTGAFVVISAVCLGSALLYLFSPRPGRRQSPQQE